MKLFIDERRVKRNGMLGKILVGGGMAILVYGLIVSFSRPEEVNTVIVTALVGMIASQAGISLNNRWGRSPRTDEVLGQALKGLDDQYALFHYAHGTGHILASPAGLLGLVPRFEDGVISFTDGKWWHDRPKRGLLRRGGVKVLSDIERSGQAEVKAAERMLKRRIPDLEGIVLQPVMVFLHPSATVRVENSPLPAIHVKKLKSWIRRKERGPSLTPEQITQIL